MHTSRQRGFLKNILGKLSPRFDKNASGLTWTLDVRS